MNYCLVKPKAVSGLLLANENTDDGNNHNLTYVNSLYSWNLLEVLMLSWPPPADFSFDFREYLQIVLHDRHYYCVILNKLYVDSAITQWQNDPDIYPMKSELHGYSGNVDRIKS